MSLIIGCCGLVCSNCPVFLATISDDDAARAKTAEFFFKKYEFEFKAKDMNCDGCISENGRLIAHCNSCEIRKCCREKRLENCSVCKEQPCDYLFKFHEFSADAKASFEALVKERRKI